MEEILVFQHDPLEDLGIFARVLEKHQVGFRYIRLFQGETPTEEWNDVLGLVLLGGPMGVYEEERYPFLKWEKTVIRTALKQGVPVLGICLGAQLIAAVAGADVYRGNFGEIGWYPVSVTPEGQVDSILGYLPEKLTVFQWHRDGFGLPSVAHRLASSVHYDTQAFRIGKNVYGLQFHLEVTAAMIESWMDQHWNELAKVPHVSLDKIRADTRSYSHSLKHYGERFLSKYIHRVLGLRKQRDEKHQAKL